MAENDTGTRPQNYSSTRRTDTRKKKGILSTKVGLIAVGAVCASLLTVGVMTIPSCVAGHGSHTTTTTVSSDDLDQVVGTWTYDGQSHDVTAKDALSWQTATMSALNDDGTYDVPSASIVNSIAKNAVIVDLAEKAGLTASDEEIAAAATSLYGSDSISSIAQTYGLTEDIVRERLTAQVLTAKYKEQVTADTNVDAAPDVPDSSWSGAERASYVMKLAGDAWNTSKGAWADDTSEWASMVGDFDGETATEDQAEAAFSIASNTYVEQNQAAQDAWDDAINPELAKVTVVEYNVLSDYA